MPGWCLAKQSLFSAQPCTCSQKETAHQRLKHLLYDMSMYNGYAIGNDLHWLDTIWKPAINDCTTNSGDPDDGEGRVLETPRPRELHGLRRGGRPPAERATGRHDSGRTQSSMLPPWWTISHKPIADQCSSLKPIAGKPRGARSRRKTVAFSKMQKSNMLYKIEFFYIKVVLDSWISAREAILLLRQKFKILRPLFT